MILPSMICSDTRRKFRPRSKLCIRVSGCMSPDDSPQQTFGVLVCGLGSVRHFKGRDELACVPNPYDRARNTMSLFDDFAVVGIFLQDRLQGFVWRRCFRLRCEGGEKLGQLGAILYF